MNVAPIALPEIGPESRLEASAVASRALLQDCAFLTLVVAASFALYVGGLGFYSDDWCHIQLMANAPDQSFAGMVRSFFGEGWGVFSRPLQVLYLTGLYWLFGLNPVASHIVNGAVFVGVILLFYVCLVELGLPRLLALLAPLVYGLLPHYTAHRFWYAAFQGNLSMLFYFLSLYACLRLVRTERRRAWEWVAVLSIFASLLAYEVAAPFVLVNVALVWIAYRRLNGSNPPGALVGFLAAYVGSAVSIGILKALTTVRAPSAGFMWQATTFDFVGNVKNAVSTHFVSYGVGLPSKVKHILLQYPDDATTACTFLLGAVVFAYLFYVARRTDSTPPALMWLKAIGVGLGLFALGFAVFVGFSDIPMATTGITNRLALAASVGTAFFFVGVIGLVSSLVPQADARRFVLCWGIGSLCAASFLVVNTEAAFWVKAYEKEEEVLTDIQARFPELPSNTTLLLDGVCPYAGPAIVFDNAWDLGDALRIAYRNPSLRADVIRANMKIEETMISSWSCGWREDHPYGEKLLVYDYASKTVRPVTDSAAARAYFAERRLNCPAGREGFGVDIFAD